MTFTSGPWALDGARTPASVARLAQRASVKGSGIVDVGDMKVLALDTPGDGVRVSIGGAALENRYVSDSGQAYVVECASEEIYGADENFTGITGQGSLQSHLICVTVGDPNYSVAGHPWLTTTDQDALAADPNLALDFQYVRGWVLKNVPAGVARVEDLPSPPTFPCYALARIDVPASTSAITSGMIVDLREVVNRREKTVQINVPISTPDVLSVATAYTYETFPDNSSTSVYIPEWATKVYTSSYVYNMVQGSDGYVDAAFRTALRTAAGTFVAASAQSVYYDSKLGDMKHVIMSGPISIPTAQRGTTCKFSTEATLADTARNNAVATTTRTNVGITLRFVEEAV